MLGKLIKYEFKSTSRVMWFLYGGLLIVAILLGIVLRIGTMGEDGTPSANLGILFNFGSTGGTLMRVISGALIAVYILIAQAVFIMTTVMIVTRFYKNLLGGEGYLMHTLPVKTSYLILSKGIVAFIWMAIAVVAAIISGILLGLASGFIPYLLNSITWNEFWEGVRYILSSSIFWLGLIFTIVATISSTLTYYMSMAIGNLANKNKFLFSVIAYVGIGIVITILTSITGLGQGALIDYALDDKIMDRFLIIQIVEQAILAIGFFIGINYILKNKLNLE